jgi:hypothetical protein
MELAAESNDMEEREAHAAVSDPDSSEEQAAGDPHRVEQQHADAFALSRTARSQIADSRIADSQESHGR